MQRAAPRPAACGGAAKPPGPYGCLKRRVIAGWYRAYVCGACNARAGTHPPARSCGRAARAPKLEVGGPPELLQCVPRGFLALQGCLSCIPEAAAARGCGVGQASLEWDKPLPRGGGAACYRSGTPFFICDFAWETMSSAGDPGNQRAGRLCSGVLWRAVTQSALLQRLGACCGALSGRGLSRPPLPRGLGFRLRKPLQCASSLTNPPRLAQVQGGAEEPAGAMRQAAALILVLLTCSGKRI